MLVFCASCPRFANERYSYTQLSLGELHIIHGMECGTDLLREINDVLMLRNIIQLNIRGTNS